MVPWYAVSRAITLCALALALGPEVLPGELPRRLDGLGAAGGEEHAVEVARRELRELGRELDRGRVRVAPDREVLERARLFGRRLGQVAPTVAELHREEAGERVEVALAVGVPQVAALTAGDDRDLVALVRAEPGEVHPEVVARLLVQIVDVVLVGVTHGYRVPHA